MIKHLMLVVLASLLAVPAVAAESKEEKLAADKTQEAYTRKSITYVGMELDSGVSASPEQLAIVEKEIRAAMELKRFDYNAVDVREAGGMDGFIQLLREHVQKLAMDRAAAEAEFELRFKSARVYAGDIQRVMDSAYFYKIKLLTLRVGPGQCNTDALSILAEAKDTIRMKACTKCVPGEAVQRAHLAAEVWFYRANLTDPKAKPYELVARLRPSVAAVGNVTEMKGSNAAADQAVACAAQTLLTNDLVPALKKTPEFRMTLPMTASLDDGVEFMGGEGDAIQLDDTYEVAEFDAAGARKTIGYVKVRKVGDATGTGQGTPTYAEHVRVDRKFAGGEQLAEVPSAGWSLGLAASYSLSFTDIFKDGRAPGDDVSMLHMAGLGLNMEASLANMTGISEFYFTALIDWHYIIDSNVGGVGDVSWAADHLTFGILKRWYLNSLMLSLGVRVGGSVLYILTGDAGPGTTSYGVGLGGEGLFGLEYWLKPGISIQILNLSGRFMYHVLGEVNGEPLNFEAGVSAKVGVTLNF
jgi:hypothetical protein